MEIGQRELRVGRSPAHLPVTRSTGRRGPDPGREPPVARRWFPRLRRADRPMPRNMHDRSSRAEAVPEDRAAPERQCLERRRCDEGACQYAGLSEPAGSPTDAESDRKSRDGDEGALDRAVATGNRRWLGRVSPLSASSANARSRPSGNGLRYFLEQRSTIRTSAGGVPAGSGGASSCSTAAIDAASDPRSNGRRPEIIS